MLISKSNIYNNTGPIQERLCRYLFKKLCIYVGVTKHGDFRTDFCDIVFAGREFTLQFNKVPGTCVDICARLITHT